MRDLIGVNIVKGIGVGIDVETPNLEKDIDANMADLLYKMQSAVDYETAMTTARVVAHNNSMQSDADNNINSTESNVTIKVPVILEGKEVAEVTAPYSDKINGQRLNLAKRGLSLG